jgi:hypothetical protein
MSRSLALAAAVALTVGIAYPTDAHAANVDRIPATSCAPVDVSAMEPDDVAELLDSGWTSTPDDGMEAVYAPGCQTEVDTYPLGSTTYAATTTAYGVLDLAATASFVLDLTASGFTLLPAGTITDPAGQPHGVCLALVGDTSMVSCSDGYFTES